MNSPVISISIACLRVTLRETATPGVAQNSPKLTPEVAKRASVEATARSHAATSWQPAAVAMPCTRAITGCGMRVMLIITLQQLSKSEPTNSCVRLANISLRSCPGQKALPLAAMTTTRMAGLAAISSSAACSAASISIDNALNCLGRLSVSVVMPRASLRISMASARVAVVSMMLSSRRCNYPSVAQSNLLYSFQSGASFTAVPANPD